MSSKVQHPFSIEFITRESFNNADCDLELSIYNTHSAVGECAKNSLANNRRQTPSPSDSGMESDHSPVRFGTQVAERDSSQAELLLLEKQVPVLKATLVTDDKPSHSYIALISMAILSTHDRRMLLSDIYQYVMDNYTYYNNNEKAWRNSIRHNLSLNECFVKAGRADNGKGNYWTIHRACMADFANGDFRRRQARRRARKCLKAASQQYTQPSAYRYNVGYVPMTASHIGYHPYNTAASSALYYPQTQAAFPQMTHSLPTASHAYSTASQSQPSTSYLSACAFSGSQAMPHTTMSSAAQKLLAEQTNTAALTMQALAQQQLASSLQLQNW